MFSIQLFHAMADERERTIQDNLRTRRLLREAKAPAEAPQCPEPAQPAAWRARTPRASATTR
jgi:hypothetical protein